MASDLNLIGSVKTDFGCDISVERAIVATDLERVWRIRNQTDILLLDGHSILQQACAKCAHSDDDPLTFAEIFAHWTSELQEHLTDLPLHYCVIVFDRVSLKDLLEHGNHITDRANLSDVSIGLHSIRSSYLGVSDPRRLMSDRALIERICDQTVKERMGIFGGLIVNDVILDYQMRRPTHLVREKDTYRVLVDSDIKFQLPLATGVCALHTTDILLDYLAYFRRPARMPFQVTIYQSRTRMRSLLTPLRLLLGLDDAATRGIYMLTDNVVLLDLYTYGRSLLDRDGLNPEAPLTSHLATNQFVTGLAFYLSSPFALSVADAIDRWRDVDTNVLTVNVEQGPTHAYSSLKDQKWIETLLRDKTEYVRGLATTEDTLRIQLRGVVYRVYVRLFWRCLEEPSFYLDVCTRVNRPPLPIAARNGIFYEGVAVAKQYPAMANATRWVTHKTNAMTLTSTIDDFMATLFDIGTLPSAIIDGMNITTRKRRVPVRSVVAGGYSLQDLRLPQRLAPTNATQTTLEWIDQGFRAVIAQYDRDFSFLAEDNGFSTMRESVRRALYAAVHMRLARYPAYQCAETRMDLRTLIVNSRESNGNIQAFVATDLPSGLTLEASDVRKTMEPKDLDDRMRPSSTIALLALNELPLALFRSTVGHSDPGAATLKVNGIDASEEAEEEEEAEEWKVKRVDEFRYELDIGPTYSVKLVQTLLLAELLKVQLMPTGAAVESAAFFGTRDTDLANKELTAIVLLAITAVAPKTDFTSNPAWATVLKPTVNGTVINNARGKLLVAYLFELFPLEALHTLTSIVRLIKLNTKGLVEMFTVMIAIIEAISPSAALAPHMDTFRDVLAGTVQKPSKRFLEKTKPGIVNQVTVAFQTYSTLSPATAKLLRENPNRLSMELFLELFEAITLDTITKLNRLTQVIRVPLSFDPFEGGGGGGGESASGWFFFRNPDMVFPRSTPNYYGLDGTPYVGQRWESMEEAIEALLGEFTGTPNDNDYSRAILYPRGHWLETITTALNLPARLDVFPFSRIADWLYNAHIYALRFDRLTHWKRISPFYQTRMTPLANEPLDPNARTHALSLLWDIHNHISRASSDDQPSLLVPIVRRADVRRVVLDYTVDIDALPTRAVIVRSGSVEGSLLRLPFIRGVTYGFDSRSERLLHIDFDTSVLPGHFAIRSFLYWLFVNNDTLIQDDEDVSSQETSQESQSPPRERTEASQDKLNAFYKELYTGGKLSTAFKSTQDVRELAQQIDTFDATFSATIGIKPERVPVRGGESTLSVIQGEPKFAHAQTFQYFAQLRRFYNRDKARYVDDETVGVHERAFRTDELRALFPEITPSHPSVRVNMQFRHQLPLFVVLGSLDESFFRDALRHREVTFAGETESAQERSFVRELHDLDAMGHIALLFTTTNATLWALGLSSNVVDRRLSPRPASDTDDIAPIVDAWLESFGQSKTAPEHDVLLESLSYILPFDRPEQLRPHARKTHGVTQWDTYWGAPADYWERMNAQTSILRENVAVEAQTWKMRKLQQDADVIEILARGGATVAGNHLDPGGLESLNQVYTALLRQKQLQLPQMTDPHYARSMTPIDREYTLRRYVEFQLLKRLGLLFINATTELRSAALAHNFYEHYYTLAYPEHNLIYGRSRLLQERENFVNCASMLVQETPTDYVLIEKDMRIDTILMPYAVNTDEERESMLGFRNKEEFNRMSTEDLLDAFGTKRQFVLHSVKLWTQTQGTPSLLFIGSERFASVETGFDPDAYDTLHILRVYNADSTLWHYEPLISAW